MEMTERELKTFWRRKHNITLQEVADYIGCHFTLVSKFERNDANMNLKNIQKYNQFIQEFENKQLVY